MEIKFVQIKIIKRFRADPGVRQSLKSPPTHGLSQGRYLVFFARGGEVQRGGEGGEIILGALCKKGSGLLL